VKTSARLKKTIFTQEQLQLDLNGHRERYWEVKEEAADRTLGRSRFGRSYGKTEYGKHEAALAICIDKVA
jgi:hypothetical protein